jgi:hypothetical protein
MEEAIVVDGVPYFPTRFDFDLHQIPGELMKAPWFSGMAQGQALSLFVDLHRLTGEPRFLEAAHSTFQSFLRPRDRHETFTVEVDAEGYYWVEEYAREIRNLVLNGFVFALFGLVDYYGYTGSEEARLLAQASLTTLRDNVHLYRVPGEPSKYCLSHERQIGNYHALHIELMGQLTAISGDPFFRQFGEILEADYLYVPR